MIHRFRLRAARACTLVLLFQAFCASLSAQYKKPWTVANSFEIKTMTDLQLSPKGPALLFAVTEKNVAVNASYTSIWKLTPPGKPVLLTGATGNASSARWSPDGSQIAYFDNDNNGTALFVMQADGSAKTKLTSVEFSNSYLGSTGNKLGWSPDGKLLAFAAAGARYYKNIFHAPDFPTGNDVMLVDRLLYKGAFFYSDLRRTQIFTIPVKGGTATQLSAGDFDYHSFSWSPDGGTIACVSNQTGKDDYNANNDIILLSTKGMPMRQLTHSPGPEYQVYFSPDGSKLAYEGRLRTHRSKESDAELIKIYTMPVTGGSPVEITQPLDRWANGFQWSSDSKNVYVTVQNEGRQELYFVPAAGGSSTALVTDKGQVTAFTTGAAGEVYYVYGDFTHPDEIYRLDKNRKKEKLTGFNDAVAAGAAIMDAEHFSYKSIDGMMIDGWIMKPAGFEAGKKYPLLLDIHGGPHGQYGYRLQDRLQEFAGNGYAVVFTNPRGSSGRTQAFSDACIGDLGGKDYLDIMAGLDYAINTYSFIDSSRMGVSGISYGGYMTQWVVTHSNRFKACVPISGIVNLISAWTEGANSDWFETDMGFMPFENYDSAWASSPMKYMAACNTPTLLVNGQYDFVTSLNQADAMFTVLKKRGIDAAIALYPNEGHGVKIQPKHTADYHQRTISWFDKYLKK